MNKNKPHDLTLNLLQSFYKTCDVNDLAYLNEDLIANLFSDNPTIKENKVELFVDDVSITIKDKCLISMYLEIITTYYLYYGKTTFMKFEYMLIDAFSFREWSIDKPIIIKFDKKYFEIEFPCVDYDISNDLIIFTNYKKSIQEILSTVMKNDKEVNNSINIRESEVTKDSIKLTYSFDAT